MHTHDFPHTENIEKFAGWSAHLMANFSFSAHMHHAFDVEFAKKYGVDQAILIAHFQYWITYNASRKQNFYNGRYWTYNSYKSLTLYFPYYTEKQIRRIVGKLVDEQILITGNFNQTNYDKTTWYAFSDENIYLNNIPKSHYKASDQMGKGCENGKFGMLKGDNPSAQTVRPIPGSNSITDTQNITSPNGEVPSVNFIIISDEVKADDSKKKNSAKKRNEDDPKCEHWKAIVDVWFSFYEENKKVKPTFSKTAGKQLGEVMNNLKKRSVDKKVEWTEKNACNSLLHFLQYAHKDDWLSRNFLLKNILSNFDKIIADAIGTNGNNKNGKGHQSVSAQSAFEKLNAVNNQPGS